jgi:hypothetical protein
MPGDVDHRLQGRLIMPLANALWWTGTACVLVFVLGVSAIVRAMLVHDQLIGQIGYWLLLVAVLGIGLALLGVGGYMMSKGQFPSLPH